MKVKELLKILNKKLKPYAEFDVDDDCFKEINKQTLEDMIAECFEDTNIIVHWR